MGTNLEISARDEEKSDEVTHLSIASYISFLLGGNFEPNDTIFPEEDSRKDGEEMEKDPPLLFRDGSIFDGRS
ncbi:MAG: hypothetical protein LBC42_01405 [Puniceicoccales bacterium]|nr:hypothetical protein [Puniceicoccales bacterium]